MSWLRLEVCWLKFRWSCFLQRYDKVLNLISCFFGFLFYLVVAVCTGLCLYLCYDLSLSFSSFWFGLSLLMFALSSVACCLCGLLCCDAAGKLVGGGVVG